MQRHGSLAIKFPLSISSKQIGHSSFLSARISSKNLKLKKIFLNKKFKPLYLIRGCWALYPFLTFEVWQPKNVFMKFLRGNWKSRF